MTKLFIAGLLMTVSGLTAHAGSSATTLACSSESGRTIISGLLPGQGEETIRLNVSVASDMTTYSNASEYSDAEATVSLSAKKKQVRIEVSDHTQHITLVASGADVNLQSTNNGTKGSFTGTLTGSHPSTGLAIETPIKVRCFVTDEI